MKYFLSIANRPPACVGDLKKAKIFDAPLKCEQKYEGPEKIFAQVVILFHENISHIKL